LENIPSVELRIEGMYDSFKPSEKKVADYVLEKQGDVLKNSISRVAENAGVSEATVVKFCQTLGYSGFQELRIRLAQGEKEKEVEEIYGEIEASDNISTIINKIFQIYDQSLQNTRKLLASADISTCVQKIKKARRLFFFGFGASAIVAYDAEQKFQRIDCMARAIVEGHAQLTQASLLKRGDLVIAISHSGRTVDLIPALELARENGAGIIAITSNYKSPVANLADEALLISSRETPFRGSALASRMAQLAAIDLLFLGVATSEYEKTQKALSKTRIALSRTKT